MLRTSKGTLFPSPRLEKQRTRSKAANGGAADQKLLPTACLESFARNYGLEDKAKTCSKRHQNVSILETGRVQASRGFHPCGLYPASVRESRQKGFVNVLLEKVTRSCYRCESVQLHWHQQI